MGNGGISRRRVVCEPSASNKAETLNTSQTWKLMVKATLQAGGGRQADTRKFMLVGSADTSFVTLEALVQTTRDKFADRAVSGKILLKYRDEDGDLITLACQGDVDEFFRMSTLQAVKRSSLPSCAPSLDHEPQTLFLRLYVESPEDCTESSSGQTAAKPSVLSWSGAEGSGRPSQSSVPSLSCLDTSCALPKPFRLRRSMLGSVNQGCCSANTSSDDLSGCLSAEEFLSHHLKDQRPRRWTVGRLLGSGGCAKVYRAMYTDNGELMAVKQVQVQQHPGMQDDLTNLDREVSALKALNHPMIVRYLGIEIVENEEQEFTVVSILMELVGGASIASLLTEMGPFTVEVCQSYTAQILIGLEYLHSKGIVHRDIKGANILVDRRGNIKLTDFGASKRIADMVSKAEGASNLKGTIKWMAPEVCLGGGGCKASDVWSLGCTVVEMLSGDSPFPGVDQLSLLFTIGMGQCEPAIPSSLSSEGQDFLQRCFQHDPVDRPAVAVLRQHVWLVGVTLNLSESTESDKLTSEVSSTASSVPPSYRPPGAPPAAGRLDFSILPLGVGKPKPRPESRGRAEPDPAASAPPSLQPSPRSPDDAAPPRSARYPSVPGSSRRPTSPAPANLPPLGSMRRTAHSTGTLPVIPRPSRTAPLVPIA